MQFAHGCFVDVAAAEAEAVQIPIRRERCHFNLIDQRANFALRHLRLEQSREHKRR